MELLPALRDALPVAVPAPEWRVEPGEIEAMPFGAIGYRKLRGVALTPALIPVTKTFEGPSRDVARFLVALHAFPGAEAERIGAPRAPGWSRTLAALEADVLPALRRLLTGEEHRALLRWVEDVAGDDDLERYEPVLCHRDLWFENLLVDADSLRLVGVLDWEAARLGDPAEDLDVHRYVGEAFADAVIAGYGSADPGLPHRVDRFWELREFAGLRWALEQEDEAELADSIAKLRAGAILSPRAPRTR
jgi:aminoglycoside phosphotransferase (APT) family kinase protein